MERNNNLTTRFTLNKNQFTAKADYNRPQEVKHHLHPLSLLSKTHDNPSKFSSVRSPAHFLPLPGLARSIFQYPSMSLSHKKLSANGPKTQLENMEIQNKLREYDSLHIATHSSKPSQSQDIYPSLKSKLLDQAAQINSLLSNEVQVTNIAPSVSKRLNLNAKEKFYACVSSVNPLSAILLCVTIKRGLGNLRVLFSSVQPCVGQLNYEKEVLLMKKETCIPFPTGITTNRYFTFFSEREANFKFIIKFSNSGKQRIATTSQTISSRNSMSETRELADLTELFSTIQTMTSSPSRTFRQNYVEANKSTFGRYKNSKPNKLLLLRKVKKISRQREQREEQLFFEKFFHMNKWRINKYYEILLARKIEELEIREESTKQWMGPIKACKIVKILFDKFLIRKAQKAIYEERMIRACFIKTCIKITLKYYRKSQKKRALQRLNSGLIQAKNIYSKQAYEISANILATFLKFNNDISSLELHCSLYIQKIYRIQQQWKKVMELNNFRQNMLIERWELRRMEIYNAYREKGKKYAGICRKLKNLSPDVGKEIMTKYFIDRKLLYLQDLYSYFECRNKISLEKKRAYNAISKMSACPPDKRISEILREEKKTLYASLDPEPIIPQKPRRSTRNVTIVPTVSRKPEKKKKKYWKNDWKNVPEFDYLPSLPELTNKIREAAGIQ